jgi:hypothetical protein
MENLEQVADTLLEAVFAVRPFEQPFDELRRRDAQDRVSILLADPKGAALTDEQAARRADLMAWAEQRRTECAALHQDFKVFFRNKPRWVKGKVEKMPWHEGVLLDFDATGFQLRVRTRDRRGQEVVWVVNPDSHQVVTNLEREQLRLKSQIGAAQRKLEALVVEVKELQAQQQELDYRFAAEKAQVSTLLTPKKEKGASK